MTELSVLRSLRTTTACAVGVSGVWFAGAFAAWTQLPSLAVVPALLAAAAGVLMLPFYGHAVAGPASVRNVPGEWLVTLCALGPVAFGATLGAGALCVSWQTAAVGACLGALMGVVGGPFAAIPFVASLGQRPWTIMKRTMVVAFVQAGLVLFLA